VAQHFSVGGASGEPAARDCSDGEGLGKREGDLQFDKRKKVNAYIKSTAVRQKVPGGGRWETGDLGGGHSLSEAKEKKRS